MAIGIYVGAATVGGAAYWFMIDPTGNGRLAISMPFSVLCGWDVINYFLSYKPCCCCCTG